MCNFGRAHYGEHSCEIIRNLNQWFTCPLKKQFTDDRGRLAPYKISIFLLFSVAEQTGLWKL